MVAKSNYKAEYKAMAHATVIYNLASISYMSPMTMFCDDYSTICFASNLLEIKTKHT